jgi:hypothetical protein
MRIRKRYRVTVDIDVNVDELTMDEARARVARQNAAVLSEGFDLGKGALQAAPDERDVAAIRALQHELMRRPDALDRWLRQSVEVALLSRWDETTLATEDEETLLRPVVERLPPPYRHWWRQTLYSDDERHDRLELLLNCIESESGPLRIREIPRPEN